MRPWAVCFLLSCATAVAGLISEVDWSGPVELEELERVAHAGGAAGRQRYSNSAEAVRESLEKGFRFIELDFVWTSDGHLVCLHGWGDTAWWMLGHKGPPLDLAGFEAVAKRGKYTALTLADVAELMRLNPAMVLVTDPKSDNVRALEQVKRAIPDAEARVVPQIYSPEEYPAVKHMGFARVIWTLYNFRHQRDVDRVVEEAEAIDLYAVCMPERLAKAGHALRLREIGVPTYVHTINEPETWKELREVYGVAEIYTDFLAPSEEE